MRKLMLVNILFIGLLYCANAQLVGLLGFVDTIFGLTTVATPSTDDSNNNYYRTTEGIFPDPITNTPITTTTTFRPKTISSLKCATAKTKVNGRSACAGKVVYQENFGSNFLADNNWNVEVKFADAPDYEFVVYTDDSRVIYADGEVLNIRPQLTDDVYGAGFIDSRKELDLGANCTGALDSSECVCTPGVYGIVPPVTSALINTKNHFNFRYGIISVRAKMPQGDWIYPELYLNPVKSAYGPGYESGQIRIAFTKGNADEEQNLYAGCVLGESSTGRSHAIKNFVKDGVNWHDDYHIYTVRWEPESITLLVDGEEYGEIYAPAGGFSTLEKRLNQKASQKWKTKFAPFDQDMYISVGVGIGGHNFYDADNRPWQHKSPKEQKQFYRSKDQWYSTWNQNSVLQVDYIKVKAL